MTNILLFFYGSFITSVVFILLFAIHNKTHFCSKIKQTKTINDVINKQGEQDE